MTEIPNNDAHEVVRGILNALDPMDAEERERILRAVSAYFDLDVSNGPHRITREPRPVVHVATNDRKLSFADRATLSPKEFLHEKQPKTNIERVACLAYYLAHYRDTPHFKTIDISRLNTEAAQLKFSNPTNSISNAVESGLIAAAGKGKRQISAIGERFVDALPDRDDAKAVLASVRPRRRRRKPSRTKTRKATK